MTMLATAPNAAVPVGARKRANDAGPKTLYVRRQLKNAKDLVRWARDAGFKETMAPDEMHVTLAFSKAPFDWSDLEPDTEDGFSHEGTARSVKPLGDKGAVVLRFNEASFEKRWKAFRDAGASWDFPGFQPHVTITYKGGDVDLSKVKPYDGPLEFGPEIFEEVDEGWADKVKHAKDAMAKDRSIRELDIDGRMHIRDVNVCMESVSPYRGGEIPGWNALGLKEDEIYQVYRPGAELSRPETIASANGIPLLRRHVAVSADDHKHMDTIGTTGTTARWEAPFIKNDLAVWVTEDIEGIEDKSKHQLSPGYRYVPVVESGSFNGDKYQIRMTNILFNHISAVHQGRQGTQVAIDTAEALQWAALEQAILSLQT